MKKRLQDSRNKSLEDSLLTYGRPSVSAWVAAAAVAFAFFILGGFIKTYRQLETLQEESRYEVAQLRETIRRLRDELGRPQASATVSVRNSNEYPHRLTPMPPARRDDRERYSLPPEQPVLGERQTQFLNGGPGQDAQTLRPALRPSGKTSGQVDIPSPAPAYFDAFAETQSEPERPRYQIGRTYEQTDNRVLGQNGATCQVISVSADKKRLIIEGGRDIGIDKGARLELCRSGRWTGDIRVVDVYDTQSACETLHATSPPQPGDTLRRPPQSR